MSALSARLAARARRDAAIGLRAVVDHQRAELKSRDAAIAALAASVVARERTITDLHAAAAAAAAARAPAAPISDSQREWDVRRAALDAAAAARAAGDAAVDAARDLARVYEELDIALRRTSARALLDACTAQLWCACMHAHHRSDPAECVLNRLLDGCAGFRSFVRVTAAENFCDADRVIAAMRALAQTVGEHACARDENEDAESSRSIPLRLLNSRDGTTYVAFAALVHFTGRSVRSYIMADDPRDLPTFRVRAVRHCGMNHGTMNEADVRAMPLLTYSAI
jgi:hypothetical protein